MDIKPFVILLVGLLFLRDAVLGKSSYYYSHYVKTWDAAQQDCAHVGGNLLKVDNSEEYDYILSRFFTVIHAAAVSFFMGLSDQAVEGEYRWTDGTLLGWAKWIGRQPSRGAGEDCVEFKNTGYNDMSCNTGRYFICEVDEDSPEAKSKADILSCWLVNDILQADIVVDVESTSIKCPRNMVYFSPTIATKANAKTWAEGNAFCKEANGQLAKITTLEEQTMIERKIRDSDPYWIGGTDVAVEGEFKWADGENATILATSSIQNTINYDCLYIRKWFVWLAGDCSVKHRILCEMPIDLMARGQACYWSLPSETWPNQVLSCEAAGGTLAMIHNRVQHERARKIFRSFTFVFIGLSDTEKTYDFRWIDGSVMTWAWWGSNEPSHSGGLEPYVGTVGNTFNDVSATDMGYGLCEKSVATFRNAQVSHTNGGIAVVCHDSCHFSDGSDSKAWTCGQDLPEEHEGCVCPEGESSEDWSVQEQWISHLNISVLFDNDTASCFDFADITKIATLQRATLLHGQFHVHVKLPAHLEGDRYAIIKVLTSEDVSDSGNDCQKTVKDLKQCSHVESHRYVCDCLYRCRLLVKLFFVSASFAYNSLPVCEIRVI